MAISKEMRLLAARWRSGQGWPLRLEWFEVDGLRGWSNQRFVMSFPIMAVVGENGAGKSTLLQAAAAVYRSPGKKGRFASDFFPDTAWDRIRDATIRYSVKEGTAAPIQASIRKPGERWRGNPDRRERPVEYIDLSRIQPVPARLGYSKLANPQFKELSSSPFDSSRLQRFSQIMGRQYESARMSITDAAGRRSVPVLTHSGSPYSGFHQGAGETTIAELLQADLPRNGLVLIDEIETSLHPRAQRRLIRDLAEKCRERELQVILTTHSPYVLDELPLEARAYITFADSATRTIMYGVSPDFAMSKMDDVPQYECDLYVEDDRAAAMVSEILAVHAPALYPRCRTVAYGGEQVGRALGTMVYNNRFPRASCVFLDGDQDAAQGCIVLPGDDAPERVVFEAMGAGGWYNLAARLGRPHADVADACTTAMTIADHHVWVSTAATKLTVSGSHLWQALCSEWAKNCLDSDDAKAVTQPVEDAILARSGASIYPANVPLPLS